MKKLTLAALVIGTFAAQAHAQSNVTVYGVVDLGLAKSTGGPTVERENHASRLGFKGSEDLGNGLSAIFNLENEFQADTGVQNGGLFDRQANVGLKGAFGTAYIGRTKDLIDGAQVRIDPFGADGVVGERNKALLRSGKVLSSRVANSITYNSPNMNGVVASAQAVLSEVSGMDAGYAGLLTYDNGPIGLHAGYERTVQTVANVEPNVYSLGASYVFGDAKISAGYNKGDTKVAKTGKFESFLIGLNYTIGQGDAKASYAKGKQKVAGVADKDVAKEFGLGYDYHMSKRTDLYAYAGRESVASVTSYQFGMSHKF